MSSRSFFALATLLVLGISVQLDALPANQNSLPASKPFDPAPWQEDFSQLLAAMSNHYANLEWAIEGRHMDLPKIRQATVEALRNAQSETQARAAIDKFINAFGDGHLEIDWPEPAKTVEPSTSHGDLCERLGYSTQGNGPGLDFAELPQFVPVSSADDFFPGGLLKLSGRRKIGIIRIGLFAETGYPAACETVVKALHLPQATKCDAVCEDRVQLAVANFLTTALVRRADELRKAGATRLLLDITANGGGSNWAEVPPRVLSSKPLRDSKYAFIRSEHWVQDMEKRLTDVDSDLKHNRSPHDVLISGRNHLLRMIEQSKAKCDRSSVWHDGTLKCSQLVEGEWFTSGVLPYAKPGSYSDLESRYTLYHPLRYSYSESSNRLPIYVAVDWNTWSAAEYVAAILQDNHAAIILGTPTGGAGCGYTNGGIPTTLKNSGANVKMPDCVRIRADGRNAVDGVMPDKLIGWAKYDSPYEKAEILYSTLSTLP